MRITDRSILWIAIVFSTAFIIAAFTLSYTSASIAGLPLGSDSSAYAGQAQLVASQGPGALLAVQGPYNFLYQLITGLIVWTGVPAISVEIVSPVILAASLPYLLSRLTLARLNRRAGAIVALGAPGWYAVYRIGADLNANLLGLVFCIASITVLSDAHSIRQKRGIVGLGLLALASISHIESTVFFVSIFAIASISSLRVSPIRVVYAAAVVIIPATVLYAFDFQNVLALTGGSYDFSPTTMSGTIWLTYLGPLLPLAILGIISLLVRRVSWIEVLVLVWSVMSILIGLTQYGSPQLINFAKRSVILTPVPFLALFGMRSLSYLAGRIRTAPIRIELLRRAVVVVIVIFVVSSWPFVYESVAQQNLTVFLTKQQYQELVWVKSHLGSNQTPIFMLNDYNQYAGGLARQYDSWISAIIGNHLSYLGLTDYLVQLEETPFSDSSAKATSAFFMQQIRAEGILNRTLLLRHQIFLMGDFYRPSPVPSYTSSLFTRVAPGIYIDNPVPLQSLSNITLPLYTTFADHIGSWGAVNASWTKSGEAYEIYHDTGPADIEATFYVNVAQAGVYSLALRYWDQTGNNLTVALDSEIIGMIQYTNAKLAVVQEFSDIALVSGTHMVKITIQKTPYQLQWASLDYLELTRF